MNQPRVIELIRSITLCSHRLKAVGRCMGAFTSRGGAWGLMKSLDLEGPQTIPDLARARPVSRQHIRALAQSLIERGWVETVANPAHRRSFLLQLTPGGKQAVSTMDRQITSSLEPWLAGLGEDQLATALKVLESLAADLSGKLANPDT